MIWPERRKIGDTTSNDLPEALLTLDYQSLGQFYHAFDFLPGPVTALDPAGKILYLNKKACEILHCAPVTAVGLDWFNSFVAENFRNVTRQSFYSLIAGNPPYPITTERVATTAAGPEIFLEWHNNLLIDQAGQVTGVLRSGVDVTSQLKIAENKILKNRNLYAVLSKTNEAIVRIKDRASLFREVCRVAVEHGGLKMAWIGEPSKLSDAIVPVVSYGSGLTFLDNIYISQKNDVPEGNGPTGIAFRENRFYVCNDFINDPVTLPWRDKISKYSFKSSASLPLNQSGEVSAVLTVYADEVKFFDQDIITLLGEMALNITYALDNFAREEDRQKTENELAASREQLRQAQKMEAIGRLAGGVAHDFNNLLTAILGYTELLEIQLQNDSQPWEEVVEIKKVAERATHLTRHLLALSRTQVLNLKVLNLNRILADTEKMLSRLIGEDIELITRLGQDTGYVLADETQLQQIIMNLAVNSRDAMPRGGQIILETYKVSISAEETKHNPELLESNFAVLSVIDTGCGIETEMQSQIFEPFFTTKEEGKGTGLGLSTVYGIVKQNKGFIEVNSQPGSGSCFKIYWPLVQDQHLNEQPQDIVIRKNEIATETVLVVEDDFSIRILTTRLLKKAGYHVLDSANPHEALNLVQTLKEPIQLLLTDIIMPGMNGRELGIQVQKLRPEIKILYTSGYNEQIYFENDMTRSNINFFQKPYSATCLYDKVREVLAS